MLVFAKLCIVEDFLRTQTFSTKTRTFPIGLMCHPSLDGYCCLHFDKVEQNQARKVSHEVVTLALKPNNGPWNIGSTKKGEK